MTRAHAEERAVVPMLYCCTADPMKVVIAVSWTYNCAPDDFPRITPLRNAMLALLQAKVQEHHLAHTAVVERIRGAADKEKGD